MERQEFYPDSDHACCPAPRDVGGGGGGNGVVGIFVLGAYQHKTQTRLGRVTGWFTGKARWSSGESDAA